MMRDDLENRNIVALRRMRPDLAAYLDDFYIALTFPHAFDFQRMPLRWQEAQALLSELWHKWKMLVGKCGMAGL